MPSITDGIFDSILKPPKGKVSAPHAKYIHAFDFNNAVKDRADELSYRAQDGTLSDSERHELETYLSADASLSILRSKPRLALRETDSKRRRRTSQSGNARKRK